MNIFSKAVTYIENVAHSANGLLVKIFGQSAVSAVESDLATIFKEDVITIFSDAITLAESLQVDGQAASGDQKRSAAFSQIVKDLAAKGINLADNVINLGIELVVGLIKSKTPAAAAPAAPTAPAAPVKSGG